MRGRNFCRANLQHLILILNDNFNFEGNVLDPSILVPILVPTMDWDVKIFMFT